MDRILPGCLWHVKYCRSLYCALSCLVSLSVTWKMQQSTFSSNLQITPAWGTSQYMWGQGYCAETPRHAGRMGQQEHYEIQQEQIQSPRKKDRLLPGHSQAGSRSRKRTWSWASSMLWQQRCSTAFLGVLTGVQWADWVKGWSLLYSALDRPQLDILFSLGPCSKRWT